MYSYANNSIHNNNNNNSCYHRHSSICDLHSSHKTDASFLFRTIYDLSFFVIVIVIILNLIFGVIVDTFAALRQEKQNSEELNKNHCCVCGLHRSAFDHSNTSFDEHVEVDHNVWHYIYFIIYLRTKLTDDLTGLEIYIDKLIKDCQPLKVIICTFTLQRRMAMINIRC
ncbi:unnamed protein product [Schistosoma curassoni]|uniref:Ion_trans domain-containing protein n=1 Tax=Schistosoma curassoni TaxID=6186 RepID=A0A183KDD4_9TREM|nr:unnamed protein product [Schistosoma curassoni]